MRKEVFLFDIIGGGELDVLYQRSKGYGRMQMSNDVQMIFYAIDAIEMAVFVFQDAPDVFEEFLPVWIGEGSFPVLCGEHDLVEDLGVGTHGFFSFPSVSPMVIRIHPPSADGSSDFFYPLISSEVIHIQPFGFPAFVTYFNPEGI